MRILQYAIIRRICRHLQPDFNRLDNGILEWNYKSIDRWDLFGFEQGFDGYVFRANDILWLANNGKFDKICLFEGMVCHNGRRDLSSKNMMMCPEHSCVCIEQINVTHEYRHNTTNWFTKSLEELNNTFLSGKEIDIDSIDFSKISCPHGEFAFSFKDFS